MGWSPDNVDIIINTHLHHDHCSENRSFNNCRFYVQEKEYQVAMNPAEHQKKLYKRDLSDPNAVNYFDWVFVKGEEEILPGIKVIPTPGHSAGQQSVLVNTEEGIPDYPFQTGDEVVVLVSGLGATPLMELYVLFNEIEKLLQEKNIRIYRSYVGKVDAFHEVEASYFK